MTELKVGDKFPDNVIFKWSPADHDDPTVCYPVQNYNASKEWKDKKVVLISVPGAFTPGCQGSHLPPYIEKRDELKNKGVDIIAVAAYNDAFVMSAWGRVNHMKQADMIFLSDTETKFARKIGWTLGEKADWRSMRYAMIIDHGTVTYAEHENAPPDVTVSGVDAVLAKL